MFFCCRLLIFFKINFFEKKNSGIPSEYQFGSRSGQVLSGLIWAQTVCKGYQQTTLVDKELDESALIVVIQRSLKQTCPSNLLSFTETAACTHKVGQ